MKQRIAKDSGQTVTVKSNGRTLSIRIAGVLKAGTAEQAVNTLRHGIVSAMFPTGIPVSFNEALTASVADIFNSYEFEPVISEDVENDIKN